VGEKEMGFPLNRAIVYYWMKSLPCLF